MATSLTTALAAALDCNAAIREEAENERAFDFAFLSSLDQRGGLANELHHAGVSLGRWWSVRDAASSTTVVEVVTALMPSPDEFRLTGAARAAIADWYSRHKPGSHPPPATDTSTTAASWAAELRATGRLSLPSHRSLDSAGAYRLARRWLERRIATDGLSTHDAAILAAHLIEPSDDFTRALWPDAVRPGGDAEDLTALLAATGCAIADPETGESGTALLRLWEQALAGHHARLDATRHLLSITLQWHRTGLTSDVLGDAVDWSLVLLRICDFGHRGGPAEADVALVEGVLDQVAQLTREGLATAQQASRVAGSATRHWSRRQLIEFDVALRKSISARIVPRSLQRARS